jgi:hypothetical protein
VEFIASLFVHAFEEAIFVLVLSIPRFPPITVRVPVLAPEPVID